MKKIFFSIFCTITLLGACSEKKVTLATGSWRGVIQTKGGELPFNFSLAKNSDSTTYRVFILNGDEKLLMDTVRVVDDSLKIPMELFDSELIGKIDGKKLTGIWRKKRSNGSFIRAKFTAEQGPNYRFSDKKIPTNSSLSGKYATTFISEDKKDTTVSVGIFNQNGNELKGTFLTPTGDYRYLDGNVLGDSLFLSCFDGNHVYLFKAQFDANKKSLNGQFWSNATNLENWTALQDETAKLPDEKSLTFLKKGYSTLTIAFPNEQGKKVSLKDEKYKDKVIIVQILGSWCPNCMDESRFLGPWYKKNKQRGIEIIGLAYEKFTDPTIAFPKIQRMKERFGMDYEVLLAGSNNKADASKTLPMLNKIVGFPDNNFY